jgi:hypothetical protein
MSVFKISEGLCEEFMKMTRDFWCGDENERRKIHWMRWDKVTRRKGQGVWDSGTFISLTKLYYQVK